MGPSEPCRIIPFPKRANAADSEPERLQRSMAALQQALLEQGEAVAAWRRSIDDLRDGMATLRGSVQVYETAVAKLAQECAPASR